MAPMAGLLLCVVADAYRPCGTGTGGGGADGDGGVRACAGGGSPISAGDIPGCWCEKFPYLLVGPRWHRWLRSLRGEKSSSFWISSSAWSAARSSSAWLCSWPVWWLRSRWWSLAFLVIFIMGVGCFFFIDCDFTLGGHFVVISVLGVVGGSGEALAGT